MLNIVIFSGGTGSIALQTGLSRLYGDAIKVDIILSAYDNGKSTGECRKVFNGHILGPSDLRKNQLTQFKLINHIDESNPIEDDKLLLYRLFNTRFTKASWEESYSYVKECIDRTFDKINQLGFGTILYDKKKSILLQLLDFFFYSSYTSLNKIVRPTIPTTFFTDFSISNLFYAAAAAINDNSLGLAGQLMAEILGIPNNVHLISDINLYLYAETLSGSVISDEGVIVAWNHPEDPIVNISLLDEKGNKYVPRIDEENQTDISCKDLISEADIIIFSSGTQWSSLIPTYVHLGLKEVLQQSKAKKYLIMNNVQDCDMKGVDADGLLKIVNRYINLVDVKIVINTNAQDEMAKLNSTDLYQILEGELSEKNSKKHSSEKLVNIIFKDYFADYLLAKFYYFDFDDTIWSSSKNRLHREYSQKNLVLLFKSFSDNSFIISGNSANHFISLTSEFRNASLAAKKNDPLIKIYCNGGNCYYTFYDGHFNYITNLCSNFNLNEDYYILSENILKALKNSGWKLNLGNFENRGNCILSIKPLQNREQAKLIIDDVVLKTFGEPKYTAYINGNTTIDIMNTNYNKRMCASTITNELQSEAHDIVYIGDKTENGNDSCLTNMGFKVLSVKDIFDFYCFATTYITNKQ